MKVHQKWWANASADYQSDEEVIYDGRLTAAAWREALAEVLRQIGQLPDGGIVTWIAEELDGD